MNATRAQFAAPAAGRLHTQRAAMGRAAPLAAPLGLGRTAPVPARRRAVAVKAAAEPQATELHWLTDEWKEADRKNLRHVSAAPAAPRPARREREACGRRGREAGPTTAPRPARAANPKPNQPLAAPLGPSPHRCSTSTPGSGTAAAGGTGAT